MKLEEITESLSDMRARKSLLEESIEVNEQLLVAYQITKERIVKARWVLAEVVKRKQKRFKTRVEDLVTMALKAVFVDRCFEFELDFRTDRRNKFEVVPLVKENGNYYMPKDDMGGSILDLIGITFRVILHRLENPRSRPVFILDEPFQNLGSGEELVRGAKFIQQLANNDKAPLQFIIVTHAEELVEIADRAWRVVHDGVMSNVKLIKGGEKKRKLKGRKK